MAAVGEDVISLRLLGRINGGHHAGEPAVHDNERERLLGQLQVFIAQSYARLIHDLYVNGKSIFDVLRNQGLISCSVNNKIELVVTAVAEANSADVLISADFLNIRGEMELDGRGNHLKEPKIDAPTIEIVDLCIPKHQGRLVTYGYRWQHPNQPMHQPTIRLMDAPTLDLPSTRRSTAIRWATKRMALHFKGLATS